MKLTQSGHSLIFAVVITLLLMAMVVDAFSFRPAARTAPLLIGIPTAAVATLMVGRDLLRLRRGDTSVGAASDQERDRYAEAEEEDSAQRAAQGTPEATARLETASGLQAAFWVVGLVVLIGVLGLLIASLVFVTAFMMLFARERWWLSIAYAVTTTAVIYFLFGELLDQRLYEGLFGDVLIPF